MADPYTAGQTLGSALFGSQRGTYDDQLGRSYKIEQALQQARQARSSAMLASQINDQRALVTPELVSGVLGGDAAALGTLGSISLLANDKFDAGQLTDVLGAAARGSARTAALGGDWDGANANLMAVANGPQELGAVQGQNLLQNRFLTGGGGISTTEQGRAGIAADAARARASDASAASAYASAARTRQATALDRADVLGGGGGKPTSRAPSGYRWNASGNLEAIPGGPADKGGGGAPSANQVKAQQANATKTAQLGNVNRGLSRIESALGGLSGSLVDTGPLDQYLVGKTEAGQELEAAVGAIQNSMLALTRVPGVGAQSDLEARMASLQYPSLANAPEVNRRTLKQLQDFVKELQAIGDAAAPAGTLGDRPAPAGRASPGLPAAAAPVDDLLGKYGIR